MRIFIAVICDDDDIRAAHRSAGQEGASSWLARLGWASAARRGASRSSLPHRLLPARVLLIAKTFIAEKASLLGFLTKSLNCSTSAQMGKSRVADSAGGAIPTKVEKKTHKKPKRSFLGITEDDSEGEGPRQEMAVDG
eukprot:6192707-Pleurochrysis_carterae.AAC.2